MKKIISIISVLLVCVSVSANDSIDFIPKFHGAIRSRWEMETESGKSRFQVRYARLTMQGQIAKPIDYFVQADLCDQGKMKILDVYGRYTIISGLQFQAGQFRMPFGMEPFKAPQNYVFANRSFMGKMMCNYRRVGAKVAYRIPVCCPLLVEAGVFSPNAIADHSTWNKSYVYSGKATLSLGEFKLCAGGMSILPENVRATLIDGALMWENRHFTVAAEYMNEHYHDDIHNDAHSYCTYIDYCCPTKSLGVFNQWSVQGRFDGITAHWDGKASSAVSDARNRITLGGTLTYKYKSVFSDIRLNYEKYLYHHGVKAADGAGDKIVAELVVRF